MHEEIIARYLPRIQAIQPDLAIESIHYNGEGLVNDLIIVNGALVFRFCKDDYAIRALAAEAAVLDLLTEGLPLRVPRPFHREADCIAYELLPGVTLSRDIYADLDDASQQAVADQIGGFLRALHHTPLDESIPPTLAPVTRERWESIREEVEDQVYPLLLTHQVEWAIRFFDDILLDPAGFAYTPCLIHGDLGPYHLLFDPATKRLGGVIDFGVAGRGDPATDLAAILQIYGEGMIDRLAESYPEASRHLKRARFYAQAIEFQWVLNGLKTGEPFWFTAHLGGARPTDHERAMALERTRQELAVAKRIQGSFLPAQMPALEQLPGWTIHASLEAARETSGDFYDVIELWDGRLALVVADVADKGVGAALMGALCRTLLRTYAIEYSTRYPDNYFLHPERVLNTVNKRILEDAPDPLFCTAFIAFIDPASDSLIYANAGHNPPLLAHPKGQIERLVRTGVPLGVLEDRQWDKATVMLLPGDVLAIYSDGLTDAESPQREPYRESRLQSALQKAREGGDARAIHDALLADVGAHRAGMPPFDDLTLLVLHRGAAPKGRGSRAGDR